MKCINIIRAVAILSITGCTIADAPELPRVEDHLDLPAQFATQQPQRREIVSGLLELFKEPALTQIVEQALVQNLDIKIAKEQMKQAGFNAEAAAGNAYPVLNGAVSGSHSGGDGSPTTRSYIPSLDVSWEIDLWGRLADSRAASRATAAAQSERLEAMRISIAAQVMQAWFDAVTAEKRRQLENNRLTNLRTNAGNTRSNYGAGLGSLDDVAAIERDVALSENTAAQLTGLRNNARRTLDLLLGKYPDATLAAGARLPKLRTAPDAGVPLNVLANRPDLKAAWQDVVAANKQVSVAQKDLLPSLSITGSLGNQSSSFSDFFSGATVWSLAESLTIPIFAGDRRKAEIKRSASAAEQAWLSYLRIMLIAFSEVEQGLDQEWILARREADLHKAVKHAEDTATLFENQYRAGLSNILDYLTAANAVFNIRSQLLDVQNDRLKNRVALALALGKGV